MYKFKRDPESILVQIVFNSYHLESPYSSFLQSFEMDAEEMTQRWGKDLLREKVNEYLKNENINEKSVNWSIFGYSQVYYVSENEDCDDD